MAKPVAVKQVDQEPSNTANSTVYRPNGQAAPPMALSPFYVNPQYLVGGRKSLSGISVRAFALGIALGISSLLAVELAYYGYGLWRAPFFIAVLGIFHYLEFDMTARCNPPDAQISSFLLLSNGSAYTVAHMTAMAEVLLRHWLSSDLKPEWLRIPVRLPTIFPFFPSWVPVALGMFFVIVGQLVRSMAMMEAKTNFNHIVQSTKKEDHVLVTSGVYAFCRHPSYFGFFWWGLGTQLVLGNSICFLIYAVILWKFFSHRIVHEEKYLVSFFGQAYLDYCRNTPILIPFVY